MDQIKKLSREKYWKGNIDRHFSCRQQFLIEQNDNGNDCGTTHRVNKIAGKKTLKLEGKECKDDPAGKGKR